MALPTLNWKFVGSQKAASTALTAFNAAVYQLGQATTYADGTTRTPGTGSAWTWNRELSGLNTVAAYGTPPTAASFGMRYILAGDGVAAPATILAPDTAITTTVYMGMNRGVGAYGTWTAAQPFTSGFSGYWRGFGNFGAAPTVYLYESQEGCVIVVTNNTGGVQIGQFGALYDPLTSSGVEADGRLYFMQTPGFGATLTSTWLSSTTLAAGAWGNHSTTANQAHCGYFSPGLTTVTTSSRGVTFAASPWLAFNGSLIPLPFYLVNGTGAFVGEARNAYVVRDYAAPAVVKSGATTLGFATSYFTGATGDTVMVGV